jgi:hypothetical protein
MGDVQCAFGLEGTKSVSQRRRKAKKKRERKSNKQRASVLVPAAQTAGKMKRTHFKASTR